MAAEPESLSYRNADASPRQLIMTAEQAIRSGEKFRRNEIIPLSSILIEPEDFITDPHHVDFLREKIIEDGQSISIFVSAYIDEKTGEIRHRLLDGFHRTEAMLSIDHIKTAKAVVFYGLTIEEEYDERIIAAHSVGSIQLARGIQWMESAYRHSKWYRPDLSLRQVFYIANDHFDGHLANRIPVEDRPEFIKWATKKAALFKTTPKNMYERLVTVSNADPNLVKQVRDQRGGLDEHEAVLTVEKLSLIANRFPKEENYPIQNALVDFILVRKLRKPEILQLVDAVEDLIQKKSIDVAELPSVFDEIMAAMPQGEKVKLPRMRVDGLRRQVRSLQLRIEELEAGEEDVSHLRQQIAELREDLSLETAENGRLRREYMVLDNQFKAARRGTQDVALEPHRDENGDLRSPSGMLLKTGREFQLAEFAEQIDRLKKTNDQLSARTKMMDQGRVGWWEDTDHTPYLTDQERSCLRALTAANGSLDGFASHLRMPVELIVKTAIGAIKKRWDTEKRIQAVGDGAW